MPCGNPGAGPGDALAGWREFEHHIDRGIAGVGVIARED
jgi:hypothetical protein